MKKHKRLPAFLLALVMVVCITPIRLTLANDTESIGAEATEYVAMDFNEVSAPFSSFAETKTTTAAALDLRWSSTTPGVIEWKQLPDMAANGFKLTYYMDLKDGNGFKQIGTASPGGFSLGSVNGYWTFGAVIGQIHAEANFKFKLQILDANGVLSQPYESPVYEYKHPGKSFAQVTNVRWSEINPNVLLWDPVPDIDGLSAGYVIYRYRDGSDNFSGSYGSGTNTTRDMSSSVDTVSIWRFGVRAISPNIELVANSLESEKSLIFNEGTPYTLPAPTNLQWSATTPGMIWDRVNGISTYSFILYKDGVQIFNTDITNGSTTPQITYNYPISFINETGSYTFTVRANGNNVITLDSDVSTSAPYNYVKPASSLSIPTGLKWNGMIAECNTVSNAAPYFFELYRNDLLYSSGWGTISANKRDFTNNMTQNGVYKFRVRTISSNLDAWANSEFSAFSDEINIGGLTKLPKPTNLQWSASTKGIINWDKAPEHTGNYRIEVYKDGLRILSTNQSGGSLPQGQYDIRRWIDGSGVYTFRIQTTGDNVNSANSDFVDSTSYNYTAPVNKLQPPTGLAWASGILANWASVSGSVLSYGLELYCDNAFVTTFSSSATSTSYSLISGMTQAGAYKFRMRTYSDDIETIAHSEFSTFSSGNSYAGTSNLPKVAAPTNLQWSGSAVGNIMWNKVEEAEGTYYLQVNKDGESFLNLNITNNFGSSSGIINHGFYWRIVESGTYSFRVQARGDNINNLNSDFSEWSEPFVYTRPDVSMGIPTGLRWEKAHPQDVSPTIAVWEKVGSSSYEVLYVIEFYKDGRLNSVNTTTSNKFDYSNPWMNRDGLGEYTFKVRASTTTSNIQTVANSVFSEVSPVSDTKNPTITINDKIGDILDDLDTTSKNDVNKAVTDIKKINSTDLAITMQDDDVANKITELEEAYRSVNNISVTTTVDPKINTDIFDGSGVEIIGAALNNNSQGGNIDLNFKVPDENESVIVDNSQYKNWLQLNIDLTGPGVNASKLDVPVRITVPIPSNILPTRFVILHYFANGKDYELIRPRINGDGTATFTLTHFSEFVFAEETTAVLFKITTTAKFGGTVLGGGSFNVNSTVTLTATPNYGYVFNGWYENGIKVSGNALYTFAATADRALEARFYAYNPVIPPTPAPTYDNSSDSDSYSDDYTQSDRNTTVYSTSKPINVALNSDVDVKTQILEGALFIGLHPDMYGKVELTKDTFSSVVDSGKALLVKGKTVNVDFGSLMLKELNQDAPVVLTLREYTMTQIETIKEKLDTNTARRLNSAGNIVFELAMNVGGIDIIKVNDPAFVTIDLSGTNLTKAQLDMLSGARILPNGKVERLGGDYHPGTKTFSFYTNRGGDENCYALILAPDIKKVSLDLESGKYSIGSSANGFLNPAPFVENGTTLVPLRSIGELLGAEIDWNGNTSTVIITLKSIKTELIIGQLLPGMNLSARIVNDRTFVPLRYVSETLGVNTVYDVLTHKVNLYR